MRKYWELAKSQIKVDIAYISLHWTSMCSGILKVFLLFYFWKAVYANRSTINEMNFSTMITYVIIALMLESYVSGVGNNLSRGIKNGEIANELLKPYHYLDKLVSLDIGFKISNLIRISFPMFLISVLVLRVELPGSPVSLFLFLISALFGVLIGTQLDLLIGILAFWTTNTWGIKILRDSIIKFFSGALVPLTLFPQWFQIIGDYLPFKHMIFIPVSIYVGQFNTHESINCLLFQFLWLILLFSIVRIVWMLSIRKITIFGG